MNIKKISHALIARLPIWGHHYCVVCNHRLSAFLPYRIGLKNLPPLMFAVDMIGSNVDHFECPWCGAHDRERHLLMYLRAVNLLEELTNKSILHFAPERRLSKIIIEKKPAQYIRCDLYPNLPDIERVDMLNIPYSDQSFDLVIANHVLEHVADDIKALQEIRRVLKAGGKAILQTPFSSKLHHTWQDEGIDNDAARLQAYGQEDHVRLYGKDIFARFASVGLIPHIGQHKNLLPEIDAEYYGVNAAEPFFLFERPANNN